MLTGAIQESLIALLCYDDTPRGAKAVRTLVPAKMFDAFYSDIASAAIDFLEKYEKPPGEHTLDLFNTITARIPQSKEIFDKIYLSLQTTREGINRDYVIQQASTFARKQRLKTGIAQALNLLDDDTDASLDKAQAFLDKTKMTAYDAFNPGTFLHDTEKSLRFLDESHKAFSMGIKEIDERGLGPARKRLWVLMALYGKGKTWALADLARRQLVGGLKVAVASLEMSEEEWCQRMYMNMFSIRKRDTVVKRVKFKRDELGFMEDVIVKTVPDRPHMQQPNIRKVLEDEVAKYHRYTKNKFVVKQFPTNSATVPDLEGWLDALEGSSNFIPDLLIVDYMDLMKIDPKYVKEETAAIGKDLRGVGIKRNMAVATVTQSNREGEGAKVLGGKHVSADFSKMAISDVYITYNQTEAEHRQGLARLYVAKGRGDADRFTVLISQAYSIGQFHMDSVMMKSDKHYWSLINEEADGD